jgi:hypothetical protein
MTTFDPPSRDSLRRSSGTSTRRNAAQSRKLGMTAMSRFTFNSVRVAWRRLSDTAVAPSACSIENATISEYDGSLPTTVMSVPCSVVTTRGAVAPLVASSTCRASSAAVACGIA